MSIIDDLKPKTNITKDKSLKCNCVIESIKTYQDIMIEFQSKFPSAEIDDYRPACGLYIDGVDDCTQIPNTIIVWLKDKTKIIYISNDH